MKTPKNALQELAHFLSIASRDAKSLSKILEDLLTPQEIITISERLQIIQALLNGRPQREISKKLKTSIGKVTRGSRVVKYGKANWIEILENL